MHECRTPKISRRLQMDIPATCFQCLSGYLDRTGDGDVCSDHWLAYLLCEVVIKLKSNPEIEKGGDTM
ncbi:unnamed protein product [Linum tenue]|uniref:Uncharacterized protein n=1 Tax=Linum tenue TaxID=586396 RepID=A0AAV0R8L2_9ROSI|nr:unnamed protein product [Linum tenue]